MNTIVILLYFLSFLIIWQIVGYPLFIAAVAILSKPKNKNYGYQPFLSILVPAYNEERTIKKRIDNLLSLDYPKDKYEIIVIESGSTDNTYQIIENLIERNNNSKSSLKLLREEERKGKVSAINLGKKHAKGDFIMITDANSVFAKNVLKEMMPHFENSRVGAVGGRFVVSNPDNEITSSEFFYWDLEHIIKEGESYLDSACNFCGTISALRKKLVVMDANILAEDLDMAIKVRRAGYKIEYEPKAIVYESAAITLHEQIIQRKRIAIGTLQSIFKHRNYFFPPRDLYSLLIFPSSEMLAYISPFIFLAFPILYVLAGTLEIIIIHFISTIAIFGVLLAILLHIKSKISKVRTRAKSRFSSFSVPKITYYVLLNEFIILLAWKDFLLRKYSVLWKKAESTRDNLDTGVL